MARSGVLSKMAELQCSYEVSVGAMTIGIDLGDRYSHGCLLGDGSGNGYGAVVRVTAGNMENKK